IRRMWVAFGLQPHRSQTFKLSNDPLFVDKVRDIVGLYLSPPNRALVLSIDEKSQIQALDREQPVLPMMPAVLVAGSCPPDRAARPCRLLDHLVGAGGKIGRHVEAERLGAP